MILITGARGHVGKRVVEMLGAEAIAVTRSPRDFRPDVKTLVGDPMHPESLKLPEKLTAVVVSPRACGPGLAALLRLAKDRGARRVVVISALTVEYRLGMPKFREAFAAAEDIARASGLSCTSLRCAEFAANTLAWAPQLARGDTIVGPYADAASPLIDEHDVAAVVARALLDPTLADKTLLLTGPESLSQRERAERLGRVLGRVLTYREVPPEDARRSILAQGLPEEVPDRLLGYLVDVLKHPIPVSPTVQNLLGRPARSFDDWACEHVAAFANRTLS